MQPKIILLLPCILLVFTWGVQGQGLIGSYKIGSATKYYYLTSVRARASMTRSICKSYGMDLLSLDTNNSGEDESHQFLKACVDSVHNPNRFPSGYNVFFEKNTHVGAVGLIERSRDNWYWLTTGNRIDYPLGWGNGEPNSSGGQELCLSLSHDGSGNFVYNDISCEAELRFVCQKIV